MAVVLNRNTQDDQQNNQQQTGPDGQPLQTIGTAAPSSQPAAQASPTKPQPQGSGRFTNIQKYLQANQKGGQQIASQVGQGLQKQAQENTQKAQNYYSQLGQNVAQAQQTAQQGQGYTKQLQDIGSQIGAAQQGGLEKRGQGLEGIQAFTQSPEFQQFQNIQAGRAINENLLNLQQQKAQEAAQAAAQGSQAAQQKLGTETGRFDLLRQQFGGGPRTGYTTGQQRLDQMLFGQGGGLGQLQAQTAKQTQADLAQAKLAAAQKGTVSQLASQEQGLIGNINQAAKSNEQAYLNMLASYGDPLQAQRNEEFRKLGEAAQTYVPTYDEKTGKYKQQAYKPGFSEEQMANLGLTDKNQGVYNVFQGEEFTKAPGTTEAERQNAIAQAIASKGQAIRTGSPVETAQDVANKEDVNRYQALAKIIGKDFVPQITQESQIGSAYKAKTDDTGLKERLAAAQAAFDQVAKEKQLNQRMGSSRWNVGATAADYLNKGTGALNYTNPGVAQNYLQDQLAGKSLSGLNSVENKQIGEAAVKQTTPGLIKQIQDFIDQQNYARTLGGYRQTVADTYRNQQLQDQGIAPKMDTRGPITGVDPTIAYLQDLANKGKLG